MINRLLDVEIQGFRNFLQKVSVPLDGDVVLVYGANGSGKTGFLSALEFGLTGSVADLQSYAADYPRCLKHIQSTEVSTVSIRFRDKDGKIQKQALSVDEAIQSGIRGLLVSRADRRFFLERCYLSQARLSRLLDLYQEIDAKEQDQPLVRFFRELLGLDLLENITTGLYEAGDIRRLEKASRSLRMLKREEKALPEQLNKLIQKREAKHSEWEQTILEVTRSIGKLGIRAPEAPWTGITLRKHRNALEKAQHEELQSGILRRLKRDLGDLEQITGFFAAASRKADAKRLKSLEAQLKSLEETERGVEHRIVPVITDVEEKLRSLNIPIAQSETRSDLYQRLETVVTVLSETIPRFEAQIQAISQDEAELNSMKVRVAEIEKAIKELDLRDFGLVETQKRWLYVLNEALVFVKGDICPVCGRDYSELNSGDLRSHVISEVKELGADVERLESLLKHHAELTADKSPITRQIGAISQRLEKERLSVQQLEPTRLVLLELSAKLGRLKGDQEEWERIKREKRRIASEIEEVQIALQQREESKKHVSSLAKKLGIAEEERPTELEYLVQTVSDRLQSRISETEEQSSNREELIRVLRRAEELATEIARLGADYQKLIDKQARINRARTEVDNAIRKARQLSRAAVSVKQNLLNYVFNESVNSLWLDMFQRLAIGEKFNPRLSETAAKRGRLQATVQGIAEGIRPFEQVAAVLSQGNLNTAALSLFLTLHLIEEPRHLLLILDDPVQSMDDVHVTQLASLLRTIARRVQRQLVIAIHERALFDYLSLELGPMCDGESLITIELSLSEKDHDTHVTNEKHLWRPDRVQFGT